MRFLFVTLPVLLLSVVGAIVLGCTLGILFPSARVRPYWIE